MAESLEAKIKSLARAQKAPSGEEYIGISLEAVEAVSSATGVGRREVEIAALELGIVPIRYHRTIGSLGIEGQLELRRARVAVIGAGGLGGTLIEILARLGIGALVIIDGESFSEDNLNRQLLCTGATVGKSKVEAAAERVALVNPAVEAEPHRVLITDENIDSLLRGCRLAVDALDNIPVRLILQKAAQRLNIPYVHGAVAGFIGEIMTVLPGDDGLTALFTEGHRVPRSGIEAEVGVPTITPWVIAALQAMEAVKVILGRGELIRNRIMYLDLEGASVTTVDLSARGRRPPGGREG